MFYHQSPNPYLVISSLLFLIPAHYAHDVEQLWPTTYALRGLVIASSAYHLTKHHVLYYIDQGAVITLFIRSIIDGLYGGPTCITISMAINLMCIYLYYYGRLTQSLIWSSSFHEATASHVFMHSIVVVGYSALILNYEKI
jgi:hypothetical protein